MFLKNLLLIFSFVIVTVSGAKAQGKNEADRVSNQISIEGLQTHLKILSSDEMEGRETGKIGQIKAAAYIENTFVKVGLIAGFPGEKYQQYYPINSDTFISRLRVGTLDLNSGTDYITPLINNPLRKFKTDKILFAGYGIRDTKYNDYQNINARGKVLLVFLSEPIQEKSFIVSGTNVPSKWTTDGIAVKLQEASK